MTTSIIYELTDARIDEIITRSTSRSTNITTTASPASVASVGWANGTSGGGSSSTKSNKPNTTSLYKKYGDGDGGGDGGGDGDDVAVSPTSSPQPKNLDNPDNSVGTNFFPHTVNQLFWCFYIAHNGMFAYDTMGNAFVAENTFKYATIDHVRANMPHIKMQFKRYRLSLPNFEAELVTSKVLSLSALLGLALCYDRNILYIDNRKYFEIAATETAPDETEFTVIEKIRNRFCVLTVAGESIVTALRATCREKFWRMDSLTSPLKSMSYYTAAELQDIYARLHIKQTQQSEHPEQLQKKMTKQDLYAAIAQNI